MRQQYEVGFDDVDFARVLYFARYYNYVERTYLAWLHQYGLSYREMLLDQQVATPIATSHCRYRGPLRMEERLEVRLALTNLTRRGFRLDFHLIRLHDDFRVAEGYLDQRFVSMQDRRPVEPPEAIYTVLEAMATESAGHLTDAPTP